MEAAILAAEEAVAARQAEVERAATAGHVALADACRALEEAQRAVERLYARWQELEGKAGGVVDVHGPPFVGRNCNPSSAASTDGFQIRPTRIRRRHRVAHWAPPGEPSDWIDACRETANPNPPCPPLTLTLHFAPDSEPRPAPGESCC